MDREAVHKITRDQHSLITADQFVDATASQSALDWAIEDGWLERFDGHRRLYIVRGAPRTPYQPIMGACLLAGSSGAASHFSGARLWDAPDIAECLPQLTLFAASHWKIPGVTVHRTKLPPAGRIDVRHGVPTVVAPLIVVQLAQLGYRFLAERTANNFLKRDVTSAGEILQCLDDAGPGRRGSGTLRVYCLRALGSRGHDDSPPARDLVAALRRADLPPFVVQHFVSVDGHDHLLDVAWPEFLVGLEYNGWEDHGKIRDSFDRDAFRRGRLTAAGWRILDVTSAMTPAYVISWADRMLCASGFWLPPQP